MPFFKRRGDRAGTGAPAGGPSAPRTPPAEPATELFRLEEEEFRALARARRNFRFGLTLAFVMWGVLIAWAIVGGHLNYTDHATFGVLLATVTIALACLLPFNAHAGDMRDAMRSVRRLHDVAARLQHASERDSLTGLYNHGYLMNRLEGETNLARRYDQELAIIMIDLNGFKAVNDTHGHLIGDAVLQQIAAALRNELRHYDILARYGGDEFCVVLPKTSRAGAQAVIEKLLASISTLSARTRAWTGLDISFEYGISSHPEDGATATDLIAAADARMHEEKRRRYLKSA